MLDVIRDQTVSGTSTPLVTQGSSKSYRIEIKNCMFVMPQRCFITELKTFEEA